VTPNTSHPSCAMNHESERRPATTGNKRCPAPSSQQEVSCWPHNSPLMKELLTGLAPKPSSNNKSVRVPPDPESGEAGDGDSDWFPVKAKNFGEHADEGERIPCSPTVPSPTRRRSRNDGTGRSNFQKEAQKKDNEKISGDRPSPTPAAALPPPKFAVPESRRTDKRSSTPMKPAVRIQPLGETSSEAQSSTDSLLPSVGGSLPLNDDEVASNKILVPNEDAPQSPWSPRKQIRKKSKQADNARRASSGPGELPDASGNLLEDVRRNAINRDIRRNSSKSILRKPLPSKALHDELLERASQHDAKSRIQSILRTPCAFQKELTERVSKPTAPSFSPSSVMDHSNLQAIHREIRLQKSGSPRHPAQATISEALKEELLNNYSPTKAAAAAPTDRLGDTSLQNINDQKSSIAELRPARRKIKWNKALTDWERKNQRNTRIDSLQIEDLQIHGSNALRRDSTDSQDSEDDIRTNPGENLDVLERNIRCCFKTIKRTSKETNKNNASIDSLRSENLKLRRELLSMNADLPHGMQSFRQSENQLSTTIEHLREKVAALDEQIGMLKMQSKLIKADSVILAEIAEAVAAERAAVTESDNEAKTNDTALQQHLDTSQDETGSVQSLDEESDIVTYLSCDMDMDDDELQRVFSFAPESLRPRMDGSGDGASRRPFVSLSRSDRTKLAKEKRVLSMAANDVPEDVGKPSASKPHVIPTPPAA